MRYYSLEHEGVIENGVLIHTKEEIEEYKSRRQSYRKAFRAANERASIGKTALT